jgi:hypothetical protein
MQTRLECKPDFDRAQRMWDALWRGTNSRPLVRVVNPKPGVKPADPPRYLDWFDGDLAPVVDQALRWAETHDFLGDAVPFFGGWDFGPDTFAAYLGAGLKLDDRRVTSWPIPCIDDWDRAEIRFQSQGHWWQRTVEFVQAFRQRCDGKLLMSVPALAANLDALAALRGTEQLLADLVDRPDQVHSALADVRRAHTEVMEAIARLWDVNRFGCVNNEGAYLFGRQSRPQCDVSCMISPAMFREFVVPCLRSEGDDAGAFVYHLDGPDAVCHLPALCEIDQLDMIAYVPGQPGQKPIAEEAVYAQADALGKGQYHTSATPREKIKRLWQSGRSRKMVFTADVRSSSEAEDVISELEGLEKRDEAHGG